MLAKVKLSLLAAGIATALVPLPGQAFTQSGVGTAIANGIPMGHEWITRLAALELLGGDPVTRPDPNDPRRSWAANGRARNVDLSSANAQAEVRRVTGQRMDDQRYQSTYKPVYDAIVGERWVDIGGFNVTNAMMPKNLNCHDAVTQEAADVQYDHFMRRFDDRGAAGGVQAARRSRDRFVQYFVTAAMAPSAQIKVWDGGGYAAQTTVDRNYFLFGRVVHLFEDSFSAEHTVRLPDDNFRRIRQVKAYLCASGAEQHSHSTSAVLNYSSGDAIWIGGTQLNVGWSGYKPSFMKPQALSATEGMRDLWAAFIRTMGTPIAQRQAVALAEANQVADNWLSFNEQEMLAWYNNPANRDATYVRADNETGPGQTVQACMQGLGQANGDQNAKAQEFEAQRRVCLYNVVSEDGYDDVFDTSLRMPYNWRWRNLVRWETPPNTWAIPTRPADTGVKVRIKSLVNNQYMAAPDGLAKDNWIYVRNGGAPVEFILVGDRTNGFLRTSNDANLFLSYRSTTGAVKLYDSPSQANFRIEPATGGSALRSLYWGQYIWLSGESPYITNAGNPSNINARWAVEEIR